MKLHIPCKITSKLPSDPKYSLLNNLTETECELAEVWPEGKPTQPKLCRSFKFNHNY